MIFHPAILALLLGSLLTSGMLLYACGYGVRILKSWDISSGSELQLSLERRTYLVSALINYGFGFQLLSLFLFIFTADHLAPLFVGAMCAAGSLNANGWGYPTILLKIFNFILAGLWIVVNYTDNRAYDYPLIRAKYVLLLLVTPLVLLETILQGSYFWGLEPNVITSCCGTLFTSDAQGVTSGILALPPLRIEVVFYLCMAATLASGARMYFQRRGAIPFAVLNVVLFAVSVASLMSFISLYYYELPTHHCPFCILQREYHYVGYPLYVTMLGGAVTGMGVGVLVPFGGNESLQSIIPVVQRNLTRFSLMFHTLALALVAYGKATSNLSLWGG